MPYGHATRLRSSSAGGTKFALFPVSGWEYHWKALPPILAAEPLKPHFQVEPGNEILEGFWLTAVFTYLNHTVRAQHCCAPTANVVYLPENSCKLTPMGGVVPMMGH
ncbi:hypothetical protein NIES4073_43130 [Kalymmatonema gypsitolerans NIES-4073]|nr:hypothetical protein NIES4073_43130 [Scytonema sp. NIES-4073]